MKSALIFQSSKALGDRLFISWMPKTLKRKHGYDIVHCASFEENASFWNYNPFVDKIIPLEEHGKTIIADLLAGWEREYSKVYDVRWHVDGRYLLFSNSKNPSTEKRRQNAKDVKYYDCYEDLELNNPNCKGDIYLSDEEKKRNQKYKNGKRRILWQLEGSGRNKKVGYMPAYVNYVQENHPEIENWIGGKQKVPISVLNGQVIDARGISAREMLSLVPIFDLVIGPESFLVNAAHVFGIRSITFLSHSCATNLNFNRGSYIKPECDCSPCYLIHKDFRLEWDLSKRARARNQETYCACYDSEDRYRLLGYKCCMEINHKKVVEEIERVIKGWS